jgi:uncharacterized YigZ family protein
LRQPVAIIFFETPKQGFPFQMTDSFFTIASPTKATIKEKGSKFIAFAQPVTDSEQIKQHLEAVRKEYFDASHHCYAWVLGPEKKQFRAFDDGEPNHTAGDPILGQIRSKNLTNIMLIVVRYFGGTKLGVSGLIAAYKRAAAAALDQSAILQRHIMKSFTLEYDYSQTTVVMTLIHGSGATVMKQSFLDKNQCLIEVPLAKVAIFQNKLDTLRAMGHSITCLD